jgi:transcriptional regulator with XRE-family HTH domain
MNARTDLITALRRARVSKNLTQAQLAAAAQIPLRTYQRAESGDAGTSLNTVLRALDALGLELTVRSKRRAALEEVEPAGTGSP